MCLEVLDGFRAGVSLRPRPLQESRRSEESPLTSAEPTKLSRSASKFPGERRFIHQRRLTGDERERAVGCNRRCRCPREAQGTLRLPAA